MRNVNDPEILLPPGVEESESEASEILAGWEGFEGLEPAGITAMRACRAKAKTDGGDDVEMLLPPGVE